MCAFLAVTQYTAILVTAIEYDEQSDDLIIRARVLPDSMEEDLALPTCVA